MHHNQDHLLKGGRAPAACRVGRHPPTSIWQTAGLVESQSGLPVQEGTENNATNHFPLILPRIFELLCEVRDTITTPAGTLVCIFIHFCCFTNT